MSEEMITRDDIERTLQETQSMISMMAKNKYTEGDEQTFEDVIDRICSIIEERGDERILEGTQLKHGKMLMRTRLAFDYEQRKAMKFLLQDKKFIPGGSVIAGLSKNKNKKSSLSNCYVLSLKNDSIESIFRCMAEAARTYSYRGGCGVDITTLRPAGEPVNNAAKSSTGAVSFMPLFSSVNATIGQSGRRGAMMISIDCRHPDLMRFIWSKADPEAVFPRDHMSQDITARYLKTFLDFTAEDYAVTGHEHISETAYGELSKIANGGKLPDVNTANISIKFTDEFMEKVKNKDPEPYVFIFPDIDADKELYNESWTGDYSAWEKIGGKIKEYRTFTAFVTRNNYKRFVGRVSNGETMTADKLLEMLNQYGTVEMTFVNPTPYEIFLEASMAAWMRGDPGVLFWDRHLEWSTFPILHPSLVPTSTNPCAEIASYPGGSCLLGAHVVSKHVIDPWSETAKFDINSWIEACHTGALLMNFFSDVNECLHPLEEQREMERYAKRTGIEFTGLSDTLSMLGKRYDDPSARAFVNKIMGIKAYVELCTSYQLAYANGPCEACAPMNKREVGYGNKAGLIKLMASPYMKNLLNVYDKFIKNDPDIEDKFDFLIDAKQLKENILRVGLRNVAMNTVGPTGTLSIMADNCSSGIEPIFSFLQKRTTRVGNKQHYYICHAPVAKHLLKRMEESGKNEVPIDAIKDLYNIVEAHELGHTDRILMQEAVQEYCDSSISSTVNLPKSCTPEEIADIYLEAWEHKLKGITVFRDGCMSGVISAVKSTKEKKDGSKVKKENNDSTAPTMDSSEAPAWGTVVELGTTARANRHEVYWNGCKMYVVVTVNADNRPMELFISNLPREVSIKDNTFDEQDYQSKMSLWMALTRTISVGLRAGVSVEMFIKQLHKAAFTLNDLMSVIARVLSYYSTNKAEFEKIKAEFSEKNYTVDELEANEQTEVCPSCGKKTIVFTGGCCQCYNPECLYSKCE